MDIGLISFAGLVLLVLTSYITSLIFDIHNNTFYGFFHFAGGILLYLFLYALFKDRIIALILVMVMGVIWEIHEWLMWKFVLKKKIFKPQKEDTRNDLIVDFLSTLAGVILVS